MALRGGVELEDREMPLTEHLEELRGRLIVCLLASAGGAAAVWAWSGELLSWLARPVGGLIFLAPTEAFFTRLKVSLLGGTLLALPVHLYQAWAFVARALGEDLRRTVSRLLPASYLLFVGGAALALFGVVPAAVRFLMAYGSEAVRPQLAVEPYVEFVAALALAFGLVFQIPLVLVFLERAGVASRAGLAAKRRYVYFLGFVGAAALTPGPDVISQLALAVPVALLFELSLLFMRGRSSTSSTSHHM